MSTKQRLLDAAEQLFAENGFAATSLRDITALAEANLASVNYHFGSKEALLEAVFDRRLRPLNRERLEMLDAFESEAGDNPVELSKILWAFLAPPFRRMYEWGEGGRHFQQLVGRIYAAPIRPAGETFIKQFELVKIRFQSAFHKALPHLSADELTRRMHHVIAAMAHTMAWGRAFCCLQPTGRPESDVVLQSILSFAMAGMRAPECQPIFHPSSPAVAAATSSGNES